MTDKFTKLDLYPEDVASLLKMNQMEGFPYSDMEILEDVDRRLGKFPLFQKVFNDIPSVKDSSDLPLKPSVFRFSSLRSGAGASTLACSFALALSKRERKTLLVSSRETLSKLANLEKTENNEGCWSFSPYLDLVAEDFYKSTVKIPSSLQYEITVLDLPKDPTNLIGEEIDFVVCEADSNCVERLAGKQFDKQDFLLINKIDRKSSFEKEINLFYASLALRKGIHSVPFPFYRDEFVTHSSIWDRNCTEAFDFSDFGRSIDSLAIWADKLAFGVSK